MKWIVLKGFFCCCVSIAFLFIFDFFQTQSFASYTSKQTRVASTSTLPSQKAYIRYSYLGNYKAILRKPKKKGKYPVVIYAYDEFYDWAGATLAHKIGFNLFRFADRFAQKGYITIIPVEKYRKVNSVLGAIHYAKKLPDADPDNIHLVGVSEGSMICLHAFSKYRKIRSLTLIGPIIIDDKGHLSLDKLHKQLKKEKTALHLVEINDVSWRMTSQRRIKMFLKTKFTNIDYTKYQTKRKYFWQPQFSYVDDLFKKINQYARVQ